MATVWVLAADKSRSVVGAPLVKAEAITGFRQTHNTVDVFGVSPGEPIIVAASFGTSISPLPEGFHLALLKIITEYVQKGLPDDHVVIVAEAAAGARATWKAYPLDDYEYPGW